MSDHDFAVWFIACMIEYGGVAPRTPSEDTKKSVTLDYRETLKVLEKRLGDNRSQATREG